MNIQQATTVQDTVLTKAPSMRSAFGQWLQEPLGSIVAASVATIGSLGLVLSGIWAIQLTLN